MLQKPVLTHNPSNDALLHESHLFALLLVVVPEMNMLSPVALQDPVLSYQTQGDTAIQFTLTFKFYDDAKIERTRTLEGKTLLSCPHEEVQHLVVRDLLAGSSSVR